jgi:hypothetical protein
MIDGRGTYLVIGLIITKASTPTLWQNLQAARVDTGIR